MGYGIEKIIEKIIRDEDENVDRIIDNDIISLFKKNKYFEGLKIVVQRIVDLIYKNQDLIGHIECIE
jgi:uncharacterized membrane protein YgcG